MGDRVSSDESDDNPASWDRVGFHIVKEVKRLSQNIHDLRSDIQADIAGLREEMVDSAKTISELKVKASVWGAIAGAVPALAAGVIYLIHKGLGGT